MREQGGEQAAEMYEKGIAGMTDSQREGFIQQFAGSIKQSIAKKLPERIASNDCCLMTKLGMNDHCFTEALSEDQKNQYAQIRSEVLLEMVQKNPEYARILSSAETAERGDARMFYRLISNNSSADEMMDHLAASTYSDGRVTDAPAYAALKEELDASLKQRLQMHAGFAGLKETPAFGDEARWRQRAKWKDEESAEYQRSIATSGTASKAISELFSNETSFVYSREREEYAARHHVTLQELAKKQGMPATWLPMFGNQLTTQAVDERAREKHDFLTSTDFAAMDHIMENITAKAYSDPAFAKLAPDEAARRISEEVVGQAMADRDLKKKMSLVTETLKQMHPALQKAHEKVSAGQNEYRQHNPEPSKPLFEELDAAALIVPGETSRRGAKRTIRAPAGTGPRL